MDTDAPPVIEIASGLRFPEGPIALPGGGWLVVEIERGTLTHIDPQGAKSVVAALGGGPNGAAIGPDGCCYVCNTGGFRWMEDAQGLRTAGQAADYRGGSIQRVDLTTGSVETLYTHVGAHRLSGSNDIVFDRHGGFRFTDFGKTRPRDMDRGGVYYAAADGSFITEVLHPMLTPNGIGLSADDALLYVAETMSGRVWQFALAGPGEIRRQPDPSPNGGTLLASLPGLQPPDSLALDSEGNVCVATLHRGGINVVSPDGSILRHVPLPDPSTTNVCFGGPELKTAYATLSRSGRLVALQWPVSGQPLHFLNR